ncbi:MFS transporter [Sphingomonas aquatilis]|uniref:MFS transporter n=1 Tax=Sphingomonas aquatilis TaxID=93063 RepID=UPI001FBA28CF|nr:MFS transporter [Sphingomonas aquatilis]GKS02610.1 MFS transporter [Sphingomonas aquatilis]
MASRFPLRSPGFLGAVALANAGGVIAYLPLLTLLLPLKVEGLSGEARIGVFTATVFAGAIAASISNVLFGWLSDRSVARGGGRRAWMAGGVAATAASYGGLIVAATPLALVAALVAFQIAVNALLAPMMAIMAEEVPDGQKGVAGGLFALGGPLASIVSTVLVGQATLTEAARFAILPAAVAACIAPLLLARARIAVADRDPRGDVRASRRDLIVAGVARLFVQIAGVVTQTYLLYYFESIVPAAERAGLPGRIGHLLTIAFIVPLPAALILGRLSDLTRRRKPAILLAALIAAAGLAGMALARGWPAGAAAFVVYTLGSSVFVALNAGVAMQLLPNPRHRGRDLGLLNLANTLPSLLGPPLAWVFATPHDFVGVMLALAVLAVGGGLTMLCVRTER